MLIKRKKKIPTALLIGIIAVLLVVVVMGGIYFAVQSSIKLPPIINSQPKPITGSLQLQKSFFGNYNSSAEYAAYAKISYNELNATNSLFSLRVFAKNPMTKIYLIDTDNYCINCFLGSTMEQDLKSYLNQYGLILNQSSFNYIQLNNISTIAPNSIVIVPSGLIPLSFLPIQNSSLQGYNSCPLDYNYSMLNLLNKGDAIIYIGDNFSRSVSCGQQIIQTPQSILNGMANIGIFTHYLNKTNAAESRNQTYLTFKNPTFIIGGQMYYSSSYTRIYNGSIISLSNYPSYGWKNATTLSRDIAALIDLHYWDSEVASGSSNNISLNKSTSSGTVEVVTNTTQITASTLQGLSLVNTYALATAYFSASGKFSEANLPFRINGRSDGSINMSSAFSQTKGSTISAVATNISGNFDSFHIYIYNMSGNEPVQSLYVGQMTPNVTFIKPISFYLPGGYYYASLIDANNKTYATGVFYIYPTSITPIFNLSAFTRKAFKFSLSSGGYPISGIPYNISINGQYLQSGTVNNTIVNYTLPESAVLNYGNETFKIGIFGSSVTYLIPYPNNQLQPPILLILFGIAGVFIIIINKILVPPNIDRYYINVQEFRHMDRAKVKEPPETILKVFDQVNYYYHWRYMPLTAEEIKSGISANVRYGNMPIAVTLQNTYNVLNKMSRKGLIVEAADYFAPKSWEDASKHDIEYLVIFRKLRDYSVANAMLFTDVDAYDNMDMIITNKGVQNYVYIYSKLSENLKLSGIPLSKNHRTFIVFLTDEDRLSFIDRLNTSYGEASEILRLSIESLDVRLIDTGDLNELKL